MSRLLPAYHHAALFCLMVGASAVINPAAAKSARPSQENAPAIQATADADTTILQAAQNICAAAPGALAGKILYWAGQWSQIQVPAVNFKTADAAELCQMAEANGVAVQAGQLTYCGLLQHESDTPLMVWRAPGSTPYAAMPIDIMQDLVADFAGHTQEGGCAVLPEPMRGMIVSLQAVLPTALANAQALQSNSKTKSAPQISMP